VSDINKLLCNNVGQAYFPRWLNLKEHIGLEQVWKADEEQSIRCCN